MLFLRKPLTTNDWVNETFYLDRNKASGMMNRDLLSTRVSEKPKSYGAVKVAKQNYYTAPRDHLGFVSNNKVHLLSVLSRDVM